MSQEKKDAQRKKERLSKNAKRHNKTHEECAKHRKTMCECIKSVVGRLELYRTYVLLYRTYVLLARPTKVRR
jgi:hypothetical protein